MHMRRFLFVADSWKSFSSRDWPLVKMPPKKRAKTTKIAAASTRESLNEVQLALDKWVGNLYSMRHNEKDTVPPHQHLPWPVAHGGTFQEVAMRAWEDPSKLVDQTASLCLRVGLLEKKDDFEDMFLKMKVPHLHALNLLIFYNVVILKWFWTFYIWFSDRQGLATYPWPNGRDQHFAVEYAAFFILEILFGHEWDRGHCQVHFSFSFSGGRKWRSPEVWLMSEKLSSFKVPKWCGPPGGPVHCPFGFWYRDIYTQEGGIWSYP